jgi:hypothetical protein
MPPKDASKRDVVVTLLGGGGHGNLVYPDGSTRSFNSFEWVADLKSFRVVPWEWFESYQARREFRDGKPYWYAYMRYEGKLFRAYIGKTDEVNGDRLRAARSKLMGKIRDAIENGEIEGVADFHTKGRNIDLVVGTYTAQNEPLYGAAAIARYLETPLPNAMQIIKALGITPVEIPYVGKRSGKQRVKRYYTADNVAAIEECIRARRLKVLRQKRFAVKEKRDKAARIAAKQARKSQK